MTEDIVMAIIVGLVVISVTVVLPLSLAYLKRNERLKTQKPLPLPDIAARLERMEAGMDAMAEQLERLGEGQRFTTKLLSQRDPRLLEKVADTSGRD
jgi:hypothetical protein